MIDLAEIQRRYSETHTKLGQLYLERVETVKRLKKLDADIDAAHKDVLHQLRAYESEASRD